MAGPAPLVLITRPRAASERFARALLHRSKANVLIAPVIETKPLGEPRSSVGYAAVILTSAQAIGQVRGAVGQTAFCVGSATAAAATDAGFDAISADGNSDDLLRLLNKAAPQGPLLYPRGEEATGDVAARLIAAGLDVDEQVVYRQCDRHFSPNQRDRISQASRVLAPVFSARSARRLAEEMPKGCAPALIAISSAVAEAWPGEHDEIAIADTPTFAGMVEAVVNALDSDSHCLS